tara:strand:+ start:171 stop:485 length:315 start_codon:yes stop_codon:yes gene_type:complete
MSKYFRQSFKLGTVLKGKKYSETLRKNMELGDPVNLKKKQNLIDQINAAEKKRRKKYSKKMRLQEEPVSLGFYTDVIQSDFKNKTGPYFDRIRKPGKGKKEPKK